MAFIKYVIESYKYLNSIIYPFIEPKILCYSHDDDIHKDSFDAEQVPISEVMQRIPFQEEINIKDSYHTDNKTGLNINEPCNNANEHAEMYDKFDEYTKLITITDKQVYAHNYNYYNDIKLHNNKVTSTKQMSPFKRTTSYNTKHYYCGFCSKIIKIPEFMYQDKAFCTVQCRTNQMNAEKKNPVREHHSFSI